MSNSFKIINDNNYWININSIKQFYINIDRYTEYEIDVICEKILNLSRLITIFGKISYNNYQESIIVINIKNIILFYNIDNINISEKSKKLNKLTTSQLAYIIQKNVHILYFLIYFMKYICIKNNMTKLENSNYF